MTSLKFKIDGNLFTKRTHAKVMREAFRDAMGFVRDQIWPTHFEINELTRPDGPYGYAKRSAKWQRKKAAVQHHQKPLVYTGRLRASVLNNSIIRATQNGGTLKAKATFPLTEDRRKEIEIVIPTQRSVISRRVKRFYQDAAQKPEFKERVRLRDGSGRFVSG